jgi:hypothetical protein
MKTKTLKNGRFFRTASDVVRVLALAVLGCGSVLPQAAEVQEQTLRLTPGWNAIHLEVQPEATDPSVLFDGVPLQSLWTHSSRVSTVEFFENQNEPMANREQWLMFVPTNRVESFQNSLFAVQGHRSYLVQLGGQIPVTLTVRGLPSLRSVAWATDDYTLRGLPVDPLDPPTFGAFFSGSPAHYDAPLRRLHSVYRLNSAGQWSRVDSDDRMVSGEACWYFTRGVSDYSGPLELGLPGGDTVDFGESVPSITLQLSNRSAERREVSIADTGGVELNPLSLQRFDPVVGEIWEPLVYAAAPVRSIVLEPGQSRELRLSVRRSDLPVGGYASVLVISDGAGTRRLVPVRAAVSENVAVALQSAARAQANRVRRSATPGDASPIEEPLPPANFAGLWYGSVVVTNVSEVHSGTLQTNLNEEVTRTGVNPNATPTASQFTLRLIVHVDTNGVTRLLKEVLQMTTLPTYVTAGDGTRVVDDPGHVVLVTDERLIPTLGGTAMRGGQPVARRLSSSHFDFPGAPERNFIDFEGQFTPGGVVRARIVIDPNFPTNPFKHTFHPDHDNLTADFKQFKAEAFSIEREVLLLIGGSPSNGKPYPAYGYSRLEGDYREIVSGLHREPISASGSFILRRISDVGVLNR